LSLEQPSGAPAGQERTLAQQLGRAFALFSILVACAFLLTGLAYAVTLAWMTPEVERGRLASVNESAAYAAMIDEENALQGYLLTRDVGFLAPYVAGGARLARANQALASYLGSDPSFGGALIRTTMAEERWQERWARAAADTRPGALAPSMTEGKALFEAFRSEEASLADALNQRNERLSEQEQRFVAARVLVELAVFAALLLLALRQHRALRDSIVTPVAALLSHIGRIRDGKLEETATRDGPRELAELAGGLNEMVHALAAARAIAESRDVALRDHSARLRQILDASREFSESLNLEYVVGAVRESTAKVGGYERVIVWLMDDEQKGLVNSDAGAMSAGRGLAGRAAKSGRIAFEGAAGEVRFGDGTKGFVRAIAIPLIVGARVVGALEARHTEAREASTEAIEILEMLATHEATAIESARLHEVVEERSQVDALTHLLNRRRLEEDLVAECKRSVRYGRPLAFVMMDIDHFKAFNDSHGHPKADTALQEVAEVVAGCARTTDTAYRYGGEEFCILLRETTAQDAMHFAERIRQRIEHRFATGESAGITASFGVAEFSADTPTPRALVEAADAAMYDSKHGGRNRTSLSVRPPVGLGMPGGDVVPAS
jgi:diguanylate cyclase (GGDEF)-like protein